MKRLEMIPEGWPCPLSECRPGHFLNIEYQTVCFKTDYNDREGKPTAYNNAGETYVDKADLVQPLEFQWVEDE